MRFIVLLFLFLNTTPLFAMSEIISQLYDIDHGTAGDETLIFLSTGQVVTVSSTNKNIMAAFHNAVKEKTWFEFQINDEREITSFKEVEPPLTNQTKSYRGKSLALNYTPSILKDIDQARGFFYEARTDAKQVSQCFNRAHIWSYEWRIKRNLYSSKAWLFFTPKFIREYKYEWWFHVAPMIHVVIDGKVRERIMDIKYSRGPVKLKQWTDIFMRNNANCPVVEKYSDYADYPESSSCYVMKSSMYYYQPIDLEEQEKKGVEKSFWVEQEVRHAYLEAFDHSL